MQNKGLYIGFGIFLAVLVGGFLLLRKPNLAPSREESVATNEASPTPQTQETGELREITVEGSEYTFSPNTLTLTEGEKVRLTFKNRGNLPHNLVIAGLNVGTKTIPAGGEDTIEFNVEESGTFDFYCAVPGHRGLGMEGTLEVSAGR